MVRNLQPESAIPLRPAQKAARFCLWFACLLAQATFAAGTDVPAGAWSAGSQATSVAMPGSTDASAGEATLEYAPSTSRGQFFAVPIPRVDPALGNGLIGAAAYIFKLNPEDKGSPASTIGAGAMWMDGGSKGAGLGGKFHLKEDRWRLMAGIAYADLRYDLIADSANGGEDVILPVSQEAYGGMAHLQYGVAAHTYLGLRLQLGTLGTSAQSEATGDLPDSIEGALDDPRQVNSLGPSFAYDTRDSAFYPRAGLAVDAGVDVYFSALGSEVSFQRYEVNFRQYLSMRQRDVLAWQAYMCATGSDPPFFLQCQVGPQSLLRGYSFGRYRGDAMAAVQTEYRWQLHPRWIAAAFAGAVQVADGFGDFSLDDTLYSGGAGLRFVVEPKNGVTLRVDYAVGQDDSAIYVSVGEAF